MFITKCLTKERKLSENLLIELGLNEPIGIRELKEKYGIRPSQKLTYNFFNDDWMMDWSNLGLGKQWKRSTTRYEDGVLFVTIPKVSKGKVQQINIE